VEHLRKGGRGMTAYDYIVAGTILLTAITLITLAIWREG
jgi:hypothetical protein